MGKASLSIEVKIYSFSTLSLCSSHNDVAWAIKSDRNNKLKRYAFDSETLEGTSLPKLRQGRLGGQVSLFIFTMKSKKALPKTMKHITSYFQFWAVYYDCDSQYNGAVKKFQEQLDVLRRLIDEYPDDMDFVTTAKGKSC